MQRSTRMPLMVGFSKIFDLAEVLAGCWRFERDFAGVRGSPLSPPEIDLSVLPILPPVLPGCNSATQGNESIPMKKMDKMKRYTGIPQSPRMLAAPNQLDIPLR
jgi:hypothetical protein